MELEFGKHFKDATNLLLMMDHDSGFVDGVETYTTSSIESVSLNEVSLSTHRKPRREPDNFLLNEDALLEKPDISFHFGENLQYEIDTADYEESRKLFFSPEAISGSVQSQNSTVVYSGLENETSSDVSTEIPLYPRIVVENKDTNVDNNDKSHDNDVLMVSASESDMSLEQTFDPVIIERADTCSNSDGSIISPLRGFSNNEANLNESTIKTLSSSFGLNGVNQDNLCVKEQSNTASNNLPEDSSSNTKKENTEILNEDNVNVFLTPVLDKVIGNIESEQSPQQASRKIENTFVRTPQKIEPGNSNWSVSSFPKCQTPSKTNPLTAVTNTFAVSKEKKRLTLVFSKTEKENGYSVKRKYPSMTPDKKICNPIDSNISPDMFEDEMVDSTPNYFEVQTQDSLIIPLTQTQTDEKYVENLDQKLLKRVQKGLSGFLPPPSVTVMQMSVHDILSKLEENKKYYFWNSETITDTDNENLEKPDTSFNSSTESNNFSKSLLLSVGLEEAKTSEWPNDYNMRCHGLYHNCGKVSEEIVDLCDKYQKRIVGAETQSTCTVFQSQNMISPSKRKMTKPRWGGKSPGRRLSHLARRRITFSSANLQAGGPSLAGSRARQILVDAKKIDLSRRRSPRKSPRKTPRKTPKKTPSKSPKLKTRTPSSSAKKKLAMRFRKLTGEFEKSVPSTSELPSIHRALFKSPDRSVKSENSKGSNRSTKRALFQSPSRDTSSSLLTSKSQDLSASEERVQLRRALFTSPRKPSPLKAKKSPFKHALKFGFEKKRKRSESDDVPSIKFPRSMSMDVRPTTSSIGKSLIRTQSDLNISLNRSQSQNEMSEQHKKKLLWAVSGALQSQNITNAHPQWKVYASVLARVTRRFYTNHMSACGASGAKSDVGTSERMHRIARHHVISVIKGKTADEIINEYVKSRAKVPRPQGYVAPDEFHNSRIKAPSGGKENVFQDRANTIESWEKKKLEQMSKPATTENKIERIRKVINFGDDR